MKTFLINQGQKQPKEAFIRREFTHFGVRWIVHRKKDDDRNSVFLVSEWRSGMNIGVDRLVLNGTIKNTIKCAVGILDGIGKENVLKAVSNADMINCGGKS